MVNVHPVATPSTSRAKVLIADDHRIVSDGLKGILEPEFELVGIVEDGRALLEQAGKFDPDVIVADITMPSLNGFDAVSRLKKQGSRAKVVFLTMHKDITYAAKAIQIGASGFVLKHSASAELLHAINAALDGHTFVSSEIASHLPPATDPAVEVAEQPSLTTRQREVLQLFAEGKSAKEVAACLGISSRTAENHKARIMSILKLATSADLVQYAMRHGLIGGN